MGLAPFFCLDAPVPRRDTGVEGSLLLAFGNVNMHDHPRCQ